jgi:hypothetical protein
MQYVTAVKCSVVVERRHCQHWCSSPPLPTPSGCVLCDVIWADSEIFVTDYATLPFHKSKFLRPPAVPNLISVLIFQHWY